MDDQHPYGPPTADQVNPKTGLTPNEEQLARNRRLAAALDRLRADVRLAYGTPHTEAHQ